MNSETTNQAAQDGAAIGVGGVTSGQAGATPSHETQQETGGSGGEQLTASQGDVEAEAEADAEADVKGGSRDGAQAEPDAAPRVPPDPAEPAEPAEPAGTSMHSGARGALDTRQDQAGGTGTGIGSPESGANQSPEDLAPPAGGKP